MQSLLSRLVSVDEYVSFNSLFEMRVLKKAEALPPGQELSILYLRCATYILGATGRRIGAFNSLFEMPNKLSPYYGLRLGESFNSLFEMRVANHSHANRGRPEDFQFSI